MRTPIVAAALAFVCAAPRANAGVKDPQAVVGLGVQYSRTTLNLQTGAAPSIESGNWYFADLFMYGVARQFFVRTEWNVFMMLKMGDLGKTFQGPSGEAFYAYSSGLMFDFMPKLSGGGMFKIGDYLSIGPGFYLAQPRLELRDGKGSNVREKTVLWDLAPQLRAAVFAPGEGDLKVAATVAGTYGLAIRFAEPGREKRTGTAAALELGLLAAYKALFAFTSYDIEWHRIPDESQGVDATQRILAGIFKVGFGAQLRDL